MPLQYSIPCSIPLITDTPTEVSYQYAIINRISYTDNNDRNVCTKYWRASSLKSEITTNTSYDYSYLGMLILCNQNSKNESVTELCNSHITTV